MNIPPLLAQAASQMLLNTPHAAPAAGVGFDVDRADVAVGFGLWVISEALSFMPRLRANGVIQLLLSLAIRAFPYEPPVRRREPMTLSRFLRGLGTGRRRF